MPTPLRPRGFTLVELMVVVAVGAILGGLAVVSLRSTVSTTRVTTEARKLATELTAQRASAVARGVPVGRCLRMPSYVNTGNLVNNNPGGRTLFVKSTSAQASAAVTQATAAYLPAQGDLFIGYTEMPSGGTTPYGYVNASSAATITIFFDGFGRPSAWAGNTCDDASKTALTLPLSIGIKQSTVATTATVTLDVDGLPRLP